MIDRYERSQTIFDNDVYKARKVGGIEVNTGMFLTIKTNFIKKYDQLNDDNVDYNYIAMLQHYKTPLQVTDTDPEDDDATFYVNCQVTGACFWVSHKNVSVVKKKKKTTKKAKRK